MSYRVTSIPRRVSLVAAAAFGVLAIVSVTFSAPPGTRPASFPLMGILLAWLAVLGVRGWRCATLLASGYQVRVRELVTTTTVQWRHVDCFVADTRLIRLPGLPVRVRRRVLGIRMRDGRTRWFGELWSSRASSSRSACRSGRISPVTAAWR